MLETPFVKTILQRVKLPAKPRDLYDLYMDPRRHGEAIGTKVWISKRRGGRFSAWDGHTGGEILDLVPGKRIVQTWRTSRWKEQDPDSVVVLTFERAREGSKLTIVQTNVPDDLYAELAKAWDEQYSSRLRDYLRQTGAQER